MHAYEIFLFAHLNFQAANTPKDLMHKEECADFPNLISHCKHRKDPSIRKESMQPKEIGSHKLETFQSLGKVKYFQIERK